MNYEDADMLYDNLEEQFEYLKKEHNFKDKDIVIDVTGGTKVVVIAGILFGLPTIVKSSMSQHLTIQ